MSTSWPGSAALVEAVVEFLDNEARPGIADPALGFKLRVAVNVLRIVHRELELGRDAESQAASALRGFLGADDDELAALNARLCEDIRQGRCDGRQEELIALLESITMDRLAIDNPRFDTYRMLRAERKES